MRRALVLRRVGKGAGRRGHYFICTRGVNGGRASLCPPYQASFGKAFHIVSNDNLHRVSFADGLQVFQATSQFCSGVA